MVMLQDGKNLADSGPNCSGISRQAFQVLNARVDFCRILSSEICALTREPSLTVPKIDP